MKYLVETTFRDKETLKRYLKGDTFESTDKDRIETLQSGGYLGKAIEEKAKGGRGRSSGKGKSDDPGGDANESSKAESEDTSAEEK